MRIFLDANILFSAAKSSGAVRAFLMELNKKGHTLVGDVYVVSEARRNLEAKFPEAMGDFGEVLKGVEVSSTASKVVANAFERELPEKDRPVLAAAIHHRCHILLTGDKTHFGLLYGQTTAGVEILSPAGLANKLGTA